MAVGGRLFRGSVRNWRDAAGTSETSRLIPGCLALGFPSFDRSSGALRGISIKGLRFCDIDLVKFDFQEDATMV